jgi:hypothetical protein
VGITTGGQVYLFVWGPLQGRDTSRQDVMAAAAPPKSMMPKNLRGLTEDAREHGMGSLEAAAYVRLGVPLA